MAASPFPEFITSRRRELDLTLGDVANSLGVSPITVSDWSSGDATPEPEHLTALAPYTQKRLHYVHDAAKEQTERA